MIYRAPHKVLGLRGSILCNFRCLGEGQVSFLPIDQKIIGLVSTETKIRFFEKKIGSKKIAKKLKN
jgi:hypothetical protein